MFLTALLPKAKSLFLYLEYYLCRLPCFPTGTYGLLPQTSTIGMTLSAQSHPAFELSHEYVLIFACYMETGSINYFILKFKPQNIYSAILSLYIENVKFKNV